MADFIIAAMSLALVMLIVIRNELLIRDDPPRRRLVPVEPTPEMLDCMMGHDEESARRAYARLLELAAKEVGNG